MKDSGHSTSSCRALRALEGGKPPSTPTADLSAHRAGRRAVGQVGRNRCRGVVPRIGIVDRQIHAWSHEGSRTQPPWPCTKSKLPTVGILFAGGAVLASRPSASGSWCPVVHAPVAARPQGNPSFSGTGPPRGVPGVSHGIRCHESNALTVGFESACRQARQGSGLRTPGYGREPHRRRVPGATANQARGPRRDADNRPVG